MIGSMFVGFIIGLMAGAITSRGVYYGLYQEENPLELVWFMAGNCFLVTEDRCYEPQPFFHTQSWAL